MGRPASEATAYARSLGLKPDQLKHMGGLERVRTMPADARTILVADAKRQSLRQLLSRTAKEM